MTASQSYWSKCVCYNNDGKGTLMGPHDIVRKILSNGDGTYRFRITKTDGIALIETLPQLLVEALSPSTSPPAHLPSVR